MVEPSPPTALQSSPSHSKEIFGFPESFFSLGHSLFSVYESSSHRLSSNSDSAASFYSKQYSLVEKYSEPELIEYSISKSDTLLGLALRFNTTVSDIKQLNSLRSDLEFFSRTKIRVNARTIIKKEEDEAIASSSIPLLNKQAIEKSEPRSVFEIKYSEPELIEHRVIPSDTLLGLALNYNTSVSLIKQLNNIETDQELHLLANITVICRSALPPSSSTSPASLPSSPLFSPSSGSSIITSTSTSSASLIAKSPSPKTKRRRRIVESIPHLPVCENQYTPVPLEELVAKPQPKPAILYDKVFAGVPEKEVSERLSKASDSIFEL